MNLPQYRIWKLGELSHREEQVQVLLGMIGQPYEEPEGCLKFLKKALAVLEIEIEGTIEAKERDALLFRKVDCGELGTVIMWDNLVVGFDEYKYHVGLMLDERWAIQSSRATNGVGRVEITRSPWSLSPSHFYRPKVLCF